MDLEHIVLAAGIIVFGVLFHSYSSSWSRRVEWFDDRWRVGLNALAFGLLSAGLTVARIELGVGVSLDGRYIPVALIGLFDRWPAGLVAALVAVGAGRWLGEGDAVDAVALVAVAMAGGAAHAWARRKGGAVGPRHAFALSGIVFVVTLGSFLARGERAFRLFGRVWAYYLVMLIVGIGLIARLLHDALQRERLVDETERFRAILNGASDAVRVVDPETDRIIEVNQADCELRGYTREEMIGRDIREFWPKEPELRTRPEAALAEARSRGFAHALDVPLATRSGKIVWVDSTRRIVAYRERRYEVEISREATDRRAAEAARREAELGTIRALANSAAHEINNPLAAIVGSLALLAEGTAKDSREHTYVERSLAAAQRIQESVMRMRQILRVEHMPSAGGLSPTLDLARSSERPGPAPGPTGTPDAP